MLNPKALLIVQNLFQPVLPISKTKKLKTDKKNNACNTDFIGKNILLASAYSNV
jgi:hypothetical protein